MSSRWTRGNEARLEGLVLALAAFAPLASAQAHGEVWRFDTLARIGGMVPTVLGHPHLERGPHGKALVFDGQEDALILPRHPLAGAARFTAEAVHLSSDDTPAVRRARRGSCSKSAWSAPRGISTPS
jgi:hypothetical protein